MQFRLSCVLSVLIALSGIVAQPLRAAEPLASSVDSNAAFDDLDTFFVKHYGPVSNDNQSKSRPMIVANGFNLELMLEDGSVKSTAGKVRQFNELKGVAHLGACIYAIGARSWAKENDQSWVAEMQACHDAVEKALAQVDSVDWSSAAWPGGEGKLKEFIRGSLQKVSHFTQERLASKSFSRAEFAIFAKDYMPTMTAAFYLDNLHGTFQMVHLLKEWKTEVGPDKWNKMFFVIAGTQGRATAGLTHETNPLAIIIASLVEPSLASSHIIIIPEATNTKEALKWVGNAITAKDLASALFEAPGSNKETNSFYSALNNCEIPLALDNVRHIVKGLKNGTAKDPVLGLGPSK